MAKTRSELLTLIKRLLAKAQYTNYPEEAEAFQSHANRLIARYAVTGYELDGAALDKADPFIHSTIDLGKGRYAIVERNNLVWLLKELKTCAIFWLPRGVRIVGRSSDVNVAAELARSLRAQGMYAMKAWWTGQKDCWAASSWPESERLWMRKSFLDSFYSAAISRLTQAVAEEAPSGSAGALVLADRSKAARGWAEANMKIRKADMRGGEDLDYSPDGYAAGMRANLNPQSLTQGRPVGALA